MNEDLVKRLRKLVERVAVALLARRGFAFYSDPMEGGQDAYDISCEALSEAAAIIPLVLEEAAKVADEVAAAWRDDGASAARAADRIRNLWRLA